ncbi:MAG: hypothetical protein R2867_45380 [Caldilineaceae bacterium]
MSMAKAARRRGQAERVAGNLEGSMQRRGWQRRKMDAIVQVARMGERSSAHEQRGCGEACGPF